MPITDDQRREKLSEALGLIAQGLTRPTKIAKALGVTDRTYRNWLIRSNRGDEAFLLDVDGEVMQFAKAVTLSTRLAGYELRGMLLQEGIFGYDEIQTKDGQVVWALCPVACAMDPDTREALGFRRDGLLEIDGALQPVTLKKKAPFAQQIRLLEAMFPDLRPSQTINQNVAVAGTVGVAFTKPIDYSRGPPQVPPPPPMPALEAPVIDATFAEVDDDLDLDDMLGPEPVAPVNIVIAPQINVGDERVYSEPPGEREKIAPPSQPVGFAEVPLRQPRNELERDLFEKLAAARAKGQST